MVKYSIPSRWYYAYRNGLFRVFLSLESFDIFPCHKPQIKLSVDRPHISWFFSLSLRVPLSIRRTLPLIWRCWRVTSWYQKILPVPSFSLCSIPISWRSRLLTVMWSVHPGSDLYSFDIFVLLLVSETSHFRKHLTFFNYPESVQV